MTVPTDVIFAFWDSDRRLFEANSWKIHVDDVLSIKSTPEAIFVSSYPLINGKRKRVLLKLRGTPETLRGYATQISYSDIPPHVPSESSVTRNQILVLLNPYSGQKKAYKHWIQDCKPIFDEAGVNYTLVETEYAQHASEIVEKMKLDDYNAIVILSGDGMVSEVLTGLLTRTDRERALKMPLLHIPAGTANALAAAVAFQAGEPFSPRGNFCPEMALMIGRPNYKPLRLYHVETAADGHKLMFLTAVWGLIADIDLGSERFRWAGLARLHMEAFIRIAQLPTVAKYRGRISYKPVLDGELTRNTRLKSREVREKLRSEYFKTKMVEKWRKGDTVAEKSSSTLQRAFEDSNNLSYKFPRLEDPVPSDWTVIEGDYAFVCLSSISHIGSDLPYCPSAKLDDEVMYLSLVDWRTIKSRFHIAHLLITIDQCLHLDHECLQIIPVTACRVEPAEGSGGYVAIDGEPVTSGSSFQVTTTHLTATVIGR
ncbi:unnamed protein product [Bursaphelenchus xylophilus]|uniref:(pine wood nematode) hypothetical protein n=1 Tax=Bursaphelenchus xylophilus TaxID=6326 RepID=A0A1I7RS81_BURXY|nr:unnamed protein product [Bursaphelenchus xylophilus]CAG9123134.1 unnamed protein product [Bursaphelenchus xylophilus]